MFGKKRCKNCDGKVGNSYNFCPYCRAPLNNSSDGEDLGLLGRNDFSNPADEFAVGLPGIPGINALFNSLLKNLNKQMNEFEKDGKEVRKQGVKRRGIGISIYAPGDRPPEIKVTSYGSPKTNESVQEKNPERLKLPSGDSKKFSGIPKSEPKTSIRRLSDKVIYEINVPGVKSLEDISIVQLESSIEVKALAKNKVYQKVIPISLPIKKYSFAGKKLTLELDAKD